MVTILKKNSALSKGVWSILLLCGMIFLASRAIAADTVTLKVYQGYKFSEKAVTKSGEKGADFSFFVNMGRSNAGSFALATLGAKKIKEFGKEKPDAKTLTPEMVSAWKEYAGAPSPGNYVVQSADGKSLYLVTVLAFKNQGKAASFWELTFSWKKI
jgi:hypothetical protein